MLGPATALQVVVGAGDSGRKSSACLVVILGDYVTSDNDPSMNINTMIRASQSRSY
jgi:hypothetical protein